MDFRSFTEHMRKEAEAATGLEVRVETVIKKMAHSLQVYYVRNRIFCNGNFMLTIC